MIDRRTLFAALAGIALAAPALAGNMAFKTGDFDKARMSGKPVLVEVTAPWCPTCKAQKPILSELKAQPRFKDLTVFEVDFDSQKDALRTLGVQKQSTLIVYKGGQEVGRSTGETSKAAIEGLLAKAL
jgi:thiol-disulfide isomerase/thioredoxin